MPKGQIKLIQPKDLDAFDEEALPRIDAPATQLRKGDVLVSNRGKFRAMTMAVDDDFVFPASVHLIRLTSSDYLPGFIAAYLNSDYGQAQLGLLASGSYITNLTKTALGELELPRVPIEKQKKIAQLDVELAEYRERTAEKAAAIENLKSVLMKEEA
jgi:restriction endonuclease S subunit